MYGKWLSAAARTKKHFFRYSSSERNCRSKEALRRFAASSMIDDTQTKGPLPSYYSAYPRRCFRCTLHCKQGLQGHSIVKRFERHPLVEDDEMIKECRKECIVFFHGKKRTRRETTIDWKQYHDWNRRVTDIYRVRSGTRLDVKTPPNDHYENKKQYFFYLKIMLSSKQIVSVTNGSYTLHVLKEDTAHDWNSVVVWFRLHFDS
jgi:hypothetical protein